MKDPYSIVDSHRVEVLAVCAGASMDDDPRAVITIRFSEGPTPYAPMNLHLTKEQAARLHMDLGRLLQDPESWIYTTPEEFQALEEPF